ncbi:heavy metal translocating P-type ATPase [Secundilactobacillus kimchicus]|nr:heavy metal translocating P-type ATPase [Secundilactobacillus kimchicus]
MLKFSNYKRLWGVLTVGAVALILQFLFRQSGVAQIVVTALGSLIACLMLVDMVKTLRSGKFGVDLLAITAVVATLAIGEYWAALIVLLMLTGGDALEDYAAHKANTDLQALLEKSPQIAHVVIEDQIHDVAVESVAVGDRLLVKPGEVVPVDGTVVAGQAMVDESSLTGESRLVEITAGSPLMSGAVNGDNTVTMVADQLAEDSQYQNIIRLVKQAEAQPAHFVRMADRYAVPFTLVAYVIAGIAWAVSGTPERFAEVLVVASPCPLILAAPIALVAGMSRASQSGIIVKTGTTLEKLAKVKTMAFDKTGTITQGNLTVAEVLPVAGVSQAALIKLAAACEQHSNHVLARSLVEVAPADLPAATNVAEVTGGGVSATVAGEVVKVGKADFVTSAPIEQQSTTAVYVSADSRYLGCITFSDQLRPEAATTVTGLHQLGVDHLMMISGDRRPIAEKIAQSVGIDDVYAECLPAEKIAVLKQLPREKRPVAMVGDGVNDAPSLVTADVGLAMGAHGATAASESADAVILKDDLSRVVAAVEISRDTMKVARQSVLIGVGICTGLMLIASTGVIPTIVGALLQEVVDTVTILAALRARSKRSR